MNLDQAALQNYNLTIGQEYLPEGGYCHGDEHKS
jgi:hypothetical protein